MAHAELNRDKALWSLASERTKNGLLLEVPLSRQALTIVKVFPQPLDEQGQPKAGCPYLFGRSGRTPFSGWSRCKERLDNRIARQRAEQRLGRSWARARRQSPATS